MGYVIRRGDGEAATVAGVIRKDSNEATRRPEPLAAHLQRHTLTRATDDGSYEAESIVLRFPRCVRQASENATRSVMLSRTAVKPRVFQQVFCCGVL
jgi:hypothetical protein